MYSPRLDPEDPAYLERLADAAASLMAEGVRPETAVRVALQSTFNPATSKKVVSRVLSILGKRGQAARLANLARAEVRPQGA